MKTNMHQGARSKLFGFAKAMRLNPTRAEELLWSRLRGKQTGFKFRRQHPFTNYVVDFYCYSMQYVIEVDGDIHDNPVSQIEDGNKDIDLDSKGIFVQRFTNERKDTTVQVFYDLYVQPGAELYPAENIGRESPCLSCICTGINNFHRYPVQLPCPAAFFF